MGDERDLSYVGQIFVGGEVPAQDRNDTECRQEVLRHHRTLQVNRIGLSQVTLIDASLKGEGGKWLLIVSPLVKESAKRELLPCKRLHEPDRYQAIVLRVGQAAEENPIHYAENGSGGADAQRQRGDHCKG